MFPEMYVLAVFTSSSCVMERETVSLLSSDVSFCNPGSGRLERSIDARNCGGRLTFFFLPMWGERKASGPSS